MLSSNQDMSSEFLALCQSQLALLVQSLGVTWTAVYITQQWKQTPSTKLVPVVVYPHTEFNSPEIWEHKTIASGLLLKEEGVNNSDENNASELLSLNHRNNPQLMVPLLYEEMVMGLLVIKREDCEWKPTELVQIEKIAQTIAIARLLDQRQAWYEQNLIDTQQLRLIEQEQLNDFLHQLRNPLTALRTFAKLLLKRLLPEDHNQKIVTGLLRETKHLQDLLEQFETNFQQQPEQPSVKGTKSSFLLPGNSLTLEPVSLLAVVEPILTWALAVAEENGITILVDIAENLPLIQADATALREALQNLVDNALKYTPIGGKIKIMTITKSDVQGFAVHDTGNGIPESVQDRIFERHYRGIQSESDIPGTGLGLAIAKELIEQMHGTIELISPNHSIFDSSDASSDGTTFIVWLRVYKE